jgi:hypothetical protein
MLDTCIFLNYETIYITREDRIRVSVYRESRKAISLVLRACEKYTFYIRIKAISF